jgi:hypothetical protein
VSADMRVFIDVENWSAHYCDIDNSKPRLSVNRLLQRIRRAGVLLFHLAGRALNNRAP